MSFQILNQHINLNLVLTVTYLKSLKLKTINNAIKIIKSN